MQFFLFSVIGSPVNSLGFLCTPLKNENAFDYHCFPRRAPLRQPLAVLVRARIQLSHFISHILGIYCLTCLRQLSSGSSRPQPNTHVVIISTLLGLTEHMYRASRLSTTGQCSRCQLCIRTTVATRNHWLSLTFRSLSQHSHIVAIRLVQNTSNSSLPSVLSSSSDPCWVGEYPNGRPNISLEQHFTQATRGKVFQHTIDRTSL